MHNRPRKLNPFDNDIQALNKQLDNDFEVHTYLQQHQLDLNNTQCYAQLLNSLVLGRRTRSKYLLKLKTANILQPETEDVQDNLQFQKIQELTGKEEQIANNLERQITQTKKSLNLLKGDIGFLVSRNQSSELLGSKVSKVKIVALDQLKRVTMAFAKDKEEVKIRNEMQKKFGKKLKNISNYESTSLTRSKQFCVQGQLRRNQVNNKLFASQLAGQNGQQMAQIQVNKQTIDNHNRVQQLALLELASVIKAFSPQTSQQVENVATLLSKIQDFLANLDLPYQPEQYQVNLAVDNILKEYNFLKDSLKAMAEFYDEQLITKEELTGKMRESQWEEHELFSKFQLQALNDYIISEDKIKCYNQKLKKFASIVKSYFKILSYLEKYDKRQQDVNTDNRRYSSLPSDISIRYITYFTQLHKTHQFLSYGQFFPQIQHQFYFSQEQINNFYDNLAKDVKGWLTVLQIQICHGNYPAQRRAYQKVTTYSQISQFAVTNEVNQPKQAQQQIAFKQPILEVAQKAIQESPNIAQRIQLLQDVDRDYYKMIKATMKMEKENTRKNYQFQKAFKRAKYASRDDILQQKRFQASFSVLFTKQSSSVLTRAFGMESTKSSQPDFAKKNHFSSQSSFKHRKQKDGQKIKKIEIKRNGYQQRQKKARLYSKLKEALVYSAL